MNRKKRHRTTPSASSSDRRVATHRPPKPEKLRVIGGDLRGRTIEYHGADYTRPMKDNIRENLFNILGPAVRGSLAFDLFAGTGALALEAISRGAVSAVAIERDRLAAEVITKNARALGVDDRLRVICGDSFRLATRLLASPEADTPWMVFLSPPYALWTEELAPLNAIVQQTLNHAPPGSVLVAETEKAFDVEQLCGRDWDVREYGSVRLAFIEPAARCGLDLGSDACF